jgi:hypothetical protein
VSDEHRDALARVIDPESWELFDDKRVKTDSIRDAIVSDSRDVASRIVDSGLMAKLDWEHREYKEARKDIMERTSRSGRCENREDGMDGYQIHDPRCPDWPDGHGGTVCETWVKPAFRR